MAIQRPSLGFDVYKFGEKSEVVMLCYRPGDSGAVFPTKWWSKAENTKNEGAKSENEIKPRRDEK